MVSRLDNYWAWWISWSPFVGMFIARISRGRTVREFITVVLFVPLIFSIIWFTSFGETAINQNESWCFASLLPISLVLFYMLDNLYGQLFRVYLLYACLCCFSTSSDSGSLVINTIASGGKDKTPTNQKVIWAIIQGLLAIVLLVGDGSYALSAIQSGAISMALPFVFILIIATISLLKGMYAENYDKKLRGI